MLGQLAIGYIATGQRDEALGLLDTTLDLGAETLCWDRLCAGVRLPSIEPVRGRTQGRTKSAAAHARQCRSRKPRRRRLLRLSDAHQTLEASFEVALQIDPNFHEARANVAALKAKAGDLSGAENEYSRISIPTTKNVPALMGLAGIAQPSRRHKAARNWLVKAVEADPRAIGPA